MQSIFGAYDIRGRFGKELTKETAYFLGQSFFIFLKDLYHKKPKIVLAIDLRPHSKILGAYFRAGFESKGGKVEYFGILPTPAFYFAAIKGKYDGGCMVTASHLPPSFNGFKLTRKKAVVIGKSSGLKKIEKVFKRIAAFQKSVNKISKLPIKIDRHFLKKYIYKNFSLFRFKFKRHLKISFNFKNTVAKVLQAPLSFYLKKIKVESATVKGKADLSISFDPDADRILFFDERGKEILPDAIALKVMETNFFSKKSRFVFAVNTSKETRDKARSIGAHYTASKVGHTLMKETMRKFKADFGYEAAGHFFVGCLGYIESPPYILFSVLKAFGKSNQKASEFFKLRRHFIYPEINFKVKDCDRVLKKIYKQYAHKAKKISRLEGLTFEFNDFWFNIRKSHTENLLRLRLEASNEKIAREKLKELKKLIS